MKRGYQREALLRFAFDVFDGTDVTVAGAARDYDVSERTIQRWLWWIEEITPLDRHENVYRRAGL